MFFAILVHDAMRYNWKHLDMRVRLRMLLVITQTETFAARPLLEDTAHIYGAPSARDSFFPNPLGLAR